jgi:L-asparaginase
MKNKILIVNTGGTFNKFYNPINGTLEVDCGSDALESLASKWLTDFDIVNIIGKDSLEMSNHDRLELLAILSQSSAERIIVVHGTDTMGLTAAYLAESDLEKKIVLTGAMVPYSIDPVEATANFASAWGMLSILDENGIYIAMNGLVSQYAEIEKDRQHGKFVRCAP